MKQRCDNPSTNGYENYGGRGITYCKRWESFENFLDDMGERPKGKTLDRIDVNDNYEPDNCRWATAKEQAANVREPRVRKPRPNASARGYDSAWEKVRAAFLAEHCNCAFCAAEGRKTPAKIAHHIWSVRDFPGRRLDPTNLMPMCQSHHSSLKHGNVG